MYAQYAIRDRDGKTVHVQVEGDSDKFNAAYRRNYGAAFDIESEELYEIVDDMNATRPSKAGSSRKYVSGTLENDGDGVDITLTENAGGSKLFVNREDDEETINFHVSDDMIHQS